jgi:hypothetical protein
MAHTTLLSGRHKIKLEFWFLARRMRYESSTYLLNDYHDIAMTYNYKQKKIVAVLSSNLEAGIALNVIGHLAISIGAYSDEELMGRPYLLDASGINHAGIAKYPFVTTKANPTKLRKIIVEARLKEDILIADYPEQMLVTGHDDELAQSMSVVKEEEINYLGAIIYGNIDSVAELTGKLSLWR